MSISVSLARLAFALTALTSSAAGQAVPVPEPSAGAKAAPTLVPFKANGRYFYVASDGALYMRAGLGNRAQLVLPAGSYAAVASSRDGKYLAYSAPGDTKPGARVRIHEIDKGRDLGEVLEHAVISRAPWTHNNRGFFYARVDTTDGRQ